MSGHCREEIAIKHVRPSRLIESLQEPSTLEAGVALTADDLRSIIVVEGNTRQVNAAEAAIKLFDVERKSLWLKIKITSKVDKSSYETTVKLGNNQLWTTSDSDSGSTITVKPSVAEDGKVQSQLIFETRGGSIESQIRLMPTKGTKLRGASECTEVQMYLPFFGTVSIVNSLPAPEVEITLLR